MKKLSVFFIFLLGLMASLASALADAQESAVVSKAEFVASQLALMEQMKQIQANEEAEGPSALEQQLSPEAYAEYQQKLAEREAEQDKQVASCLGIPVSEIANLSTKVGPDFQITLITKCSEKLPDSINLGQLELDNNSDLEAYRVCAESMVATEIGVTAEKLRQCSQVAE